jgi:hypothetical protein
MKKLLLFIYFFCFCYVAVIGQRILISGNVYDGLTFYPIQEANIYNFTTKKYTFSDSKGNFRLEVKDNDTIIVSKSIFKQVLLFVSEKDIKIEKIDIPLYFKAITLKEVTVYAITPNYKQFVQDVVKTPLPDIYSYVEGAKLTEMDLMNIKYAQGPPNILSGTPAGSPITYLYQKYNKKYKNIQLAKELNELQEEVDQVPNKYNRDLVSEITGLNGDQLLEFMMFCRFSYYDIIKMSPEEIIMEIRKKFSDYEYYKIIEEEKKK